MINSQGTLSKLRRLYYSHPSLLGPLRSLFVTMRAALVRPANAKISIKSLLAAMAEDPVIQVPEFRGNFRVGVASDLFRRVITEGSYEPILAQQVSRFYNNGRDFVDVGANVGFYTILAACLAPHRRILAVEPHPAMITRLRDNIRRNVAAANVIIFEGAVGNAPGKVSLSFVDGREEYSSIGGSLHPAAGTANIRSIEVPLTTLDYLAEVNSLDVGFLKIDVEGLEHTVLAGASNILKIHRPVILMELTDPLLRKNQTSAREVISHLARHGYQVIDPLSPSSSPGSRSFGDILCIPEEYAKR